MRKIIIANWKNNPSTFEEAQELFKVEMETAKKYSQVQTVICPPDKFLDQLSRGAVGAQDVFWDEYRPDWAISHVLVGHSDRRYGLGETDEVINQKLKKALGDGIAPILLVGEREGESREDILKSQLKKDLVDISADQLSKILFCYEPVWAISTNPNGHPDTPESALEAIGFIQNFLTKNYKLKTLNYLYGGSVNESNVADFLSKPEISGAIVGKASLDSKQFNKILKVVSGL